MSSQLKGLAGAAIKSMAAHERKKADFYPTPPDVTIALMDFLIAKADLREQAVVWEPACGDGAMAKVMATYGCGVIASDLREDSGYGNSGVNFLQTHPTEQWQMPEWIITNPPFNLAADFIRHSLSIAPNVAMLLKSQFWHAQRRAGLFRDHPPSYILALTWRPAFLEKERGKSPLMDVIWCVWSHGHNLPTEFLPLDRPSGFGRKPSDGTKTRGRKNTTSATTKNQTPVHLDNGATSDFIDLLGDDFFDLTA